MKLTRTNNTLNTWNSFGFDDLFKPFSVYDRAVDTLMSWVNPTEDSTVYAVATPGTSKEDIEISVLEGVLRVSWTQKVFSKVQEFHKTFKLPRGHDEDKVEAKLEDGILYVSVHKKPTYIERKILVE